MADIADVERALIDFIDAAVYPDGFEQPSAVDAPCRIYRGWPTPAGLNADLTAGRVDITVHSDDSADQITTRYMPVWESLPRTPTMSASVQGDKVVLGGRTAAGHTVALVIDGKPYLYRLQESDTLGVVAANLSDAIRRDRIAVLLGYEIRVPGAGSFVARVVCDRTAQREVRRQMAKVRITCWCPTPDLRDIVAATVDSALSAVAFLPLPDATHARLAYAGTEIYDQSQNALLYRRDIIYAAEYPTVDASQQPAMIVGSLSINAATFTA